MSYKGYLGGAYPLVASRDSRGPYFMQFEVRSQCGHFWGQKMAYVRSREVAVYADIKPKNLKIFYFLAICSHLI